MNLRKYITYLNRVDGFIAILVNGLRKLGRETEILADATKELRGKAIEMIRRMLQLIL